MPLTRYAVEKTLAGDGAAARGRCGLAMARAGLSTLVNPGAVPPNADLDDALARALEYLGIYPADRTAVADADLAPVGPDLQGRLLDLAEIFVLEVCYSAWLARATKRSWAHYAEEHTDATDGMVARIASLWEVYRARYERSGAPVVAPLCRDSRHGLDTHRYFRPYGPWGPPGYY